MSGDCIADRPDVAEGPEVAELTVWGRAVDRPVAGSAFPGGHSPRVGLFFTAQLTASPDVGAEPLVWADVAVMVEALEEAELVDARDEDEFCRWAVLRGPGENILETSSGFIALHPKRVLCCRVRGGATAVVIGREQRRDVWTDGGACFVRNYTSYFDGG
jgi:hypothetical protein